MPHPKKAGSGSDLDPGVVDALSRLRTCDRTKSGDLTELAQTLEDKFRAALSPIKLVTPSSKSPGPALSIDAGPSEKLCASKPERDEESKEVPTKKEESKKDQEAKEECNNKDQAAKKESEKDQAAKEESNKDQAPKEESNKDQEAKEESNKGPYAKQNPVEVAAVPEDQKQGEETPAAEESEKLRKRKLAAHARYMCYFRSVRGRGLSIQYHCWHVPEHASVASACFLRKQEDAGGNPEHGQGGQRQLLGLMVLWAGLSVHSRCPVAILSAAQESCQLRFRNECRAL